MEKCQYEAYFFPVTLLKKVLVSEFELPGLYSFVNQSSSKQVWILDISFKM